MSKGVLTVGGLAVFEATEDIEAGTELVAEFPEEQTEEDVANVAMRRAVVPTSRGAAGAWRRTIASTTVGTRGWGRKSTRGSGSSHGRLMSMGTMGLLSERNRAVGKTGPRLVRCRPRVNMWCLVPSRSAGIVSIDTRLVATTGET